MSMRAKIRIRLHRGILDREGQQVKRALEHQGFSGILDVRIGREVEFDATGMTLDEIREMVKAHVVNAVMEEFEIDLAG
jgi:phosphoribosylformylglycinamidine synthase PurS subunit